MVVSLDSVDEDAQRAHARCALLMHRHMVKKLEPGLTGDGTIQPSLAPRLDFNCAMPHMHCQCARQWCRGPDAWIGRPGSQTSPGRAIKSCGGVRSIW